MPVKTDPLPDLSKYMTFVKDMKRDLESKYKFRINGKNDAIYQSLSSIITDPVRLSLLKSTRTKTIVKLDALSAAGSAMSGAQRTESAKERIAFLKEALAAVKSVSNTEKPALVSATIKVLVDEIKDAVNQYFTGRYNGADSSGDAAFAQSVQDLLTPFTSMVHTQKNRLAGDKKVFDKNVYTSLQTLKKISDKLQTMPIALSGGISGGSTDPGIPPVTNYSSVDVVV